MNIGLFFLFANLMMRLSFHWQYGNRQREDMPWYVAIVELSTLDMKGYNWNVREHLFVGVQGVRVYGLPAELMARRELLDKMEQDAFEARQLLHLQREHGLHAESESEMQALENMGANEAHKALTQQERAQHRKTREARELEHKRLSAEIHAHKEKLHEERLSLIRDGKKLGLPSAHLDKLSEQAAHHRKTYSQPGGYKPSRASLVNQVAKEQFPASWLKENDPKGVRNLTHAEIVAELPTVDGVQPMSTAHLLHLQTKQKERKKWGVQKVWERVRGKTDHEHTGMHHAARLAERDDGKAVRRTRTTRSASVSALPDSADAKALPDSSSGKKGGVDARGAKIKFDDDGDEFEKGYGGLVRKSGSKSKSGSQSMSMFKSRSRSAYRSRNRGTSGRATAGSEEARGFLEHDLDLSGKNVKSIRHVGITPAARARALEQEGLTPDHSFRLAAKQRSIADAADIQRATRARATALLEDLDTAVQRRLEQQVTQLEEEELRRDEEKRSGRWSSGKSKRTTAAKLRSTVALTKLKGGGKGKGVGGKKGSVEFKYHIGVNGQSWPDQSINTLPSSKDGGSQAWPDQSINTLPSSQAGNSQAWPDQSINTLATPPEPPTKKSSGGFFSGLFRGSKSSARKTETESARKTAMNDKELDAHFGEGSEAAHLREHFGRDSAHDRHNLRADVMFGTAGLGDSQPLPTEGRAVEQRASDQSIRAMQSSNAPAGADHAEQEHAEEQLNQPEEDAGTEPAGTGTAQRRHFQSNMFGSKEFDHDESAIHTLPPSVAGSAIHTLPPSVAGSAIHTLPPSVAGSAIHTLPPSVAGSAIHTLPHSLGASADAIETVPPSLGASAEAIETVPPSLGASADVIETIPHSLESSAAPAASAGASGAMSSINTLAESDDSAALSSW